MRQIAGIIPGCGVLAALLVLVGQPARAETPELLDQEIADAIEDQYLVDRVVDVNRIDISVVDGIAELTGTVSNLLAKERASRIAGRVKGVRSVSNQVQVIPPAGRDDAQIQEEIADAIRRDPAADVYEVDVAVDDHVATLTGEVDSWAELQLVAKIAKAVRGVAAANNQIAVRVPEERLGTEIREEIHQRLRWNVMVDDGLINIAVRDGEVRLEGVVGSLEEKRLAESLARVAGVTSVDASALNVEWWADEEALRDGKYSAKTDEQIEQAIEDAALYDPRLLAFRIEPEVVAGWVTLRGTVDNLEAKRAAERIARSTVGVKGVTNRLKVRPEAELSDEAIEADIRGRFVVNPMIDADDVDPDVDGGRVTLSGTVDSHVERMEAARIAGKAEGVTRVSNRIVVEYDRTAPSPYYGYDYPSMSATVERLPPARNDQKIHDDIRSELFWSPFVDSDQIDVDVRDGNATLTGAVETWREYHAAEENAYEGGALYVSNRIKVQ